MAKYNLIRNGYFDSLTTSGTGNVDLNWAQLESLMDGNLTSSGVSLTAPDVLYLETDLSQRIKVDGIRLYTSDLSKSSDIKFYYKNLESDSYAGLTTYSGASYYYTIIASPSAPRYMRVTISGVAMEVYEFQIFNDDYIVAFGEDGSQYSEYLDNTPVGQVGSSEVIKLFNNDTGSIPANAYACIDYTGNAGDWYVKISASENGTYYGLTDGAVITDNDSTSYIWNMGTFSGTVTDNYSVFLPASYITGEKLGHLPNGTADEAFRTGANTWDWDRVNKKMYVMGLEGTTLSLWDYDYITDSWDYLTNLAPAVTASDRFAVMSYCDGAIYVISKYDGTFGKYTISGSVNNWANLANPTFSYLLGTLDRVSMCSDGERYIYALTSQFGQTTTNRNFKRFDTVSGTWSSMDINYQQYSYAGSATIYSNTSCLTYDYDKDRVYLINASEEHASSGHYIQLYNVSANSWGTNWFNVATVYNTPLVVESIWYHNKWLYVSCNPNFDTGYFFRYNLDTLAIEKLDLGYVHYDPSQTTIVGVYMIAIDDESDFGASVYFAQIASDKKYLYSYNAYYTMVGTYITPIIKMYDRDSSSYFTNEDTTTSGFNSISYDVGSYNGTIRVKSSNVVPMEINEIYWTTEVSNNVYLYRYNLDTGIGGDWLGIIAVSDTDSYGNTDVNRRTGHIASTFSRYNSSTKSGYSLGYINIYDRNGDTLYTKSSTRYYRLDRQLEFDKFGGLWGYESLASSYHLLHFDYQLASVLADVQTGSDFLYDMAVEMDGVGVWHTDSVNETLVHRYSNGTIAHNIQLTTPRAICGTNDNGCWVIDNTDYYARRYLSDGTISKSVYLGISATVMCADYSDGFWYYNNIDTKVRHVNSAGTELVSLVVVNVSRMKAMNSGCMVWSQVNDYVKWINNNGVVVRTINGPDSTTFCAGVFSHDYADYVNYQTDHLPLDIDPVWGTDGSAEWRKVRKSGYFLPKNQYHQAEYTLRTGVVVVSPKLDSVIIAPAVKIQDIQPQSSKDMYIRTDIPGTVDPEEYETRLKVWWGIEE